MWESSFVNKTSMRVDESVLFFWNIKVVKFRTSLIFYALDIFLESSRSYLLVDNNLSYV